MAKSSTSFEKGQDKPGRGRSFKNKLFDVIKEHSLIGAAPDISKEDAEKLYLTHFAKRAFDTDDQASGTLSNALLNKSYPSLKSTMPSVNFEFSEESTPLKQAAQILKAASDGKIPPDVAQIFISSIASMMKIEEVTEIANRLTAIEQELGIDG